MDRLKVVAVASSEERRAFLLSQLKSLDFVVFDGVCMELSDAVAKCQSQQPDVIIADLTGRELDGGLFIQAIGMNPENPCVIFALHAEMDLAVFKDAVRRGAKEFIQYPDDLNGLTVSLKKHMALMSKVASQSSPKGHAESVSVVSQPGELIAVFSAKGGAGCSSVASNLAYEMSRLGKQVAFVDLDQFYCNSEVLLASRPEYSIADLAGNNPDEVDSALIDKITFKHSSGIHVVVGCKHVLDENDMISPELLDVVLSHLSKTYAYVVIDLPTHVLDPYHQYLVEKADTLLLVSGADIPSLYRTRQYLDLTQRYLDQQKIKLLLNRHNLKSAYGMTNQELEEKFRFEIFFKIPNDWELSVEANSVGATVGKVNPKAEISKSYQKLAKLIVEPLGASSRQKQPQPEKSAGLLGKLFPKKGSAAHVVQ